ncbi:hypothetical protein CBR_g36989 [Chara braunii]|uniref:Uncharacterized protein n=1 Tax=Chara braunii TaxID=69332 RepID=A0A388JZI3_CHABU|nr:hypothetical protein CBR_g36989 [Chara braunii]|eukprot:GBG63220.1 hypothetical protein CBR_g36989 [Chara braunii]
MPPLGPKIFFEDRLARGMDGTRDCQDNLREPSSKAARDGEATSQERHKGGKKGTERLGEREIGGDR